MRDYELLVNDLRKMQSTEYCAIASATDFPAIRIVQDAADAIEELLAAVPEWVSVEERLPECGVPVLVCVVNIKRHPAEQLCGVDVYDGSKWLEASKDWKYVPTHWMPLPEPPKETKDNEAGMAL